MRRIVMTAVVALVLLAAVGVSPAFAEAPWFHLASVARPANLQPEFARNEVQEITPKGLFQLRAARSDGFEVIVGPFAPEPYFKELGEVFPLATAANVQKALEAEDLYNSGDVQVTGTGPGGQQPPFKVTIDDREVPRLRVETPGGGPGSMATVLSQGRTDGDLVVTAVNVGEAFANAEASPIKIADVLPAHVKARFILGNTINRGGGLFGPVHCELGTLTCTLSEGCKPGTIGEIIGCGGSPSLPPFSEVEVLIGVELEPGAASGELNVASVSGGGAPPAEIRHPITVAKTPGERAPFGVETLEQNIEEVGGSADTQAGSHPFQYTTTFNVAEGLDPGVALTGLEQPVPPVLPKDAYFRLPAGLIGNPTAYPRCTLAQFPERCPADSVLGVALVKIHEGVGLVTVTVPIFNLEPSVGEPARFGFAPAGVPVFLGISVRTGEDYGVTVHVDNIPETVGFLATTLTFWGVPGASVHNQAREVTGFAGGPVSQAEPQPFLTLPTACTGEVQTGFEMDAWERQGVFVHASTSELAFASEPLPAMDGCSRLPFSSELHVASDGRAASTPTGLTVAIHVPQESSQDPEGLSGAAVKDTTVTLPEGVQISPAAADGLLACSTGEIGFTGVAPVSGENQFTSGVGECPNASKVGTVEIKTPFLSEPLEGAVYLAAQDANPFGSLIGLYLEAENAKEGVRVKLAGEVKLNEATGQIVTVFPNNPEVPLEEAKLHFFGGDRAPLSTPPLCGSYTSTASIVPWSGNEPSNSTSTFEVTSGPNGSPCETPRPFQPGFEAGTTSIQAGGYSPLTLTIARPDADQALGKLSVAFPPGISAGLLGVKLCEEPQAATGKCPAESQIGQVTASAGLGGDPFSVETGKAYITGPYEGDPFGVDVVVPAVAGPFNLGTEVVRSKVDVDPTDAHLTVVSDAFPTILDGIPLQLQHINVTVNRPGFVFNPTSCEPMKIAGELESIEGATADVSTPFQVTNCAALSFKPEFKVQTSAKTSRTEGASLRVTLTLPNTPRGTGANVAKVKVSLPKQLPSPLKTLQKACTEKVFAENPSSCPVTSRVGEAHVSTPVLEGGLSGPAYFVSHGGAKYPELIVVLTGEDGVTVQVHGETFISKAGITSATFNTVPDVPFSGFELVLPQRAYPAITANGNLCRGTLIMPTEFVGQNGFKITQNTKIAVSGCPKAKQAKHKKKAKAKGGRSKKGRKK